MDLVLRRYFQSPTYTVGSLYVRVDDRPLEFLAYTLEDPVRRGPKIPGQTAIRAGTYELWIGCSPKFGRVPFVGNVPEFEHIRIHPGNTVDDTEGCILVGSSIYREGDRARLTESRKALARVMARLEQILPEPCQKTWLEIVPAETPSR